MIAMTGVPEQGVAPKPRPVSVPGGCPVYVPCSRSVKVPYYFSTTTSMKLPKYMLRGVSIYDISCRYTVRTYSMDERPSTGDEISVLSSASPAIQKTIPSNTTCGAMVLYKYTVRSTPKAGVDLYTVRDGLRSSRTTKWYGTRG